MRRPRRGDRLRLSPSDVPLRPDRDPSLPRGGGLTDAVADAVASAHRSDWARIVAGLIRVTGDWSLAEDAAQDAFAAALQRWPGDGVPDRPAAWLTTTARNKAIDRLRSLTAERARLDQMQQRIEMTDTTEFDDDRLQLIFTCCHPALPLAGRVALTLRTVAGLDVDEIARAFLVTESTMAQRLVRARQKIEHARIPYRVPPAELLEPRLSGVLAVLYLAFNAGYSDVSRSELAASAIALTESLVDLMPRASEVRGLSSLMLFQHSRRHGRVDPDGELLTIEEQDRSLWDAAEIERARRLLASAEGRGAYVVQAAIAECHATAPSVEATDWPRIIRLYDELTTLTPTAVVALNRAVAIGIGESPEIGLLLIDELATELDGFRHLAAARADLLVRAGRLDEARAQYVEAIATAATDPERRQLTRRRAALLTE